MVEISFELSPKMIILKICEIHESKQTHKIIQSWEQSIKLSQDYSSS